MITGSLSHKAWFGLGKDEPGYYVPEVRRPPSALPTARDWQKNGHQIIHGWYNDLRSYSYVQAPTGTGKTFFMAYHGEESTAPGIRVLMVARGKLVKQHRESLTKYGWTTPDSNNPAIMISPKGYRWVVLTWAAARVDAEKMARGETSKYINDQVGILFFDECHIGGCTKKDEEEGDAVSSFTKIRNHWNPLFLINVSATGNVVNETLLGNRNGHTFVYTMRQAYIDKMLHPVNMVEVHCGTTAKIADIAMIERALGRSIENLQEDDFISVASTNHDALTDQLEDKEVHIPQKNGDVFERERAIKLKDRVIFARHKCMIDLYFTHHAGEKTIFYCPSIGWAGKALDYFKSEVARRGLAINAHEAHTENDKFDVVIDAFEGKADAEREVGKVDVLFVVGMLQEGFDMPSLSLAFDCRFYRKWKAPQIARLLQKLGRLTRPWGDLLKPKRYYFARDITDYYGVQYKHKPESPDLVEKDEQYADAVIDTAARDAAIKKAAEEAAAAVAASADELPPETLINVQSGELNEIEIEGGAEINPDDLGTTRRITTVTTRFGYELADVSGQHVVNARTLGELIGAETKDIADPILNDLMKDFFV